MKCKKDILRISCKMPVEKSELTFDELWKTQNICSMPVENFSLPPRGKVARAARRMRGMARRF